MSQVVSPPSKSSGFATLSGGDGSLDESSRKEDLRIPETREDLFDLLSDTVRENELSQSAQVEIAVLVTAFNPHDGLDLVKRLDLRSPLYIHRLSKSLEVAQNQNPFLRELAHELEVFNPSLVSLFETDFEAKMKMNVLTEVQVDDHVQRAVRSYYTQFYKDKSLGEVSPEEILPPQPYERRLTEYVTKVRQLNDHTDIPAAAVYTALWRKLSRDPDLSQDLKAYAEFRYINTKDESIEREDSSTLATSLAGMCGSFERYLDELHSPADARGLIEQREVLRSIPGYPDKFLDQKVREDILRDSRNIKSDPFLSGQRRVLLRLLKTEIQKCLEKSGRSDLLLEYNKEENEYEFIRPDGSVVDDLLSGLDHPVQLQIEEVKGLLDAVITEEGFMYLVLDAPDGNVEVQSFAPSGEFHSKEVFSDYAKVGEMLLCRAGNSLYALSEGDCVTPQHISRVDGKLDFSGIQVTEQYVAIPLKSSINDTFKGIVRYDRDMDTFDLIKTTPIGLYDGQQEILLSDGSFYVTSLQPALGNDSPDVHRFEKVASAGMPTPNPHLLTTFEVDGVILSVHEVNGHLGVHYLERTGTYVFEYIENGTHKALESAFEYEIHDSNIGFIYKQKDELYITHPVEQMKEDGGIRFPGGVEFAVSEDGYAVKTDFERVYGFNGNTQKLLEKFIDKNGKHTLQECDGEIYLISHESAGLGSVIQVFRQQDDGFEKVFEQVGLLNGEVSCSIKNVMGTDYVFLTGTDNNLNFVSVFDMATGDLLHNSREERKTVLECENGFFLIERGADNSIKGMECYNLSPTEMEVAGDMLLGLNIVHSGDLEKYKNEIEMIVDDAVYTDRPASTLRSQLFTEVLHEEPNLFPIIPVTKKPPPTWQIRNFFMELYPDVKIPQRNFHSYGRPQLDRSQMLAPQSEFSGHGGDPLDRHITEDDVLYRIKGSFRGFLRSAAFDRINPEGVWQRSEIEYSTVASGIYSGSLSVAVPEDLDCLSIITPTGSSVSVQTRDGEQLTNLQISSSGIVADVSGMNGEVVSWDFTLPENTSYLRLSEKEYQGFAQRMVNRYGSEILEPFAPLLPDAKLFLDKIKTFPPAKRIAEIQQWMRKRGFYDQHNLEVEGFLRTLPYDEQILFMQKRMDDIRASGRYAPQELEGKLFACICARSALVQTNMLRHAGIVAGVAVGFNAYQEVVTRLNAHSLSEVPWPNGAGEVVPMEVDGTASNYMFALQSVETLYPDLFDETDFMEGEVELDLSAYSLVKKSKGQSSHADNLNLSHRAYDALYFNPNVYEEAFKNPYGHVWEEVLKQYYWPNETLDKTPDEKLVSQYRKRFVELSRSYNAELDPVDIDYIFTRMEKLSS